MIKNGKLINKEARIENTNFCNAHCQMCPREKMTRAKHTMGWGLFCSIVDQCLSLGVRTISVFGYGEPLIDKEIEKKVDYCSDKGLNTWVTTNASLLNRKKSYDLINAGLKNIRFSIHAASPYYYNKVHNGLDWLNVIKNIGNFLSINNKLGRPVITHVTTIPMYDEPLEHIIDMWEGRVDYLEVWKPHNWGGKKDYRENNPKKISCGRPFAGPVQIQSSGDVIPCCFLTDGEIVLGNVKKNTLFNILTEKMYENFRMLHTTGDYRNVPCETCDQRNIEDENPLLYSNRDAQRIIGKTSTSKFNVEGKNDLFTENDKHNVHSSRTGGNLCASCGA